MKNSASPKLVNGFLKFDGRVTRHLPKTLPEIEAWIIKMGGHKPTRAERARLKRFGLWGMPKE